MRQIALTDKKLRGIPRRLRAIERWAESFAGWYPNIESAEDRYYDFKIPVHVHLVEGSQSTADIRRVCAQHLIDVCAHLIAARPDGGIPSWPVAQICTPDMFMSRVTIYTDEEYYRANLTASQSRFGGSAMITDRSLAREWGLRLPPGMRERGLLLDFQIEEDNDDDRYIGEHWWYGIDMRGTSE